MKIEYFEGTDTLYIDIKETVSSESKEISKGIIADYDSEGNLTGIEIDNAKSVVNLSSLETKALPVKELMMT